MFLYDRAHTGRSPFAISGDISDFEVVWRFRLRSFPTFASETQIVQDGAGNYFFGGHDGCLYSISESGDFRWMFKTDAKVYGSPSLTDQGVVFCTGSGWCHLLDANSGLPVWSTRVADRPGSGKLAANVRSFLELQTYDYDPRQRMMLRSWASPVLSNDGQTIYCVARGTGLAALDCASGGIRWRLDLGTPRFPMSGAIVDSKNNIYVASQRGRLNAVGPGGAALWTAETPKDLNSWGGCSLNEQLSALYLVSSWYNEKGAVCAFDLSGRQIWRRNLPGALRGPVTIAYDHSLYVACGNGTLYHLNSAGEVLGSACLTNTRWLSLWTSPVIAGPDVILLSAIMDKNEGALLAFDPSLRVLAKFECGKALAPPLVDRQGRILFGSWDGFVNCLRPVSGG